MTSSVIAQYAPWSPPGEIERDPAQEALAERLTDLEERLEEHRLARKSSSLGWLFGRRESKTSRSAGSTSTARSGAARPC